MNTEYDDIIHLPHYEPKRHPRMPMAARAAQFAPFAAVAGHDAAIREEGRITDSWTELGDTGNDELNRKMEQLITLLPQHPTVTIEYFLPDSHKSGGSYQSAFGQVKRIDEYERLIELMDGRKIAIDSITGITQTLCKQHHDDADDGYYGSEDAEASFRQEFY